MHRWRMQIAAGMKDRERWHSEAPRRQTGLAVPSGAGQWELEQNADASQLRWSLRRRQAYHSFE
jgi:hypothetical protein